MVLLHLENWRIQRAVSYTHLSEENSAADEPVEMKPSDKGNGIYEYCLDRPYEYIAFMAVSYKHLSCQDFW